MNLSGKRVLLTGATGGLGWEAALTFVRSGAEVVALDIQPEKGRRLEDTARGLGSLIYVNHDLRDLEGLASRLESIESTRGEHCREPPRAVLSGRARSTYEPDLS